MKKILCPVDLGDASLNAINFAGNLAKKLRGSLTLVNFIPDTVIVSKEDFKSDELMETQAVALDNLEEVAKRTSKEFGIECVPQVVPSDLETGIRKTAEEGQYDLVIIGTSGANELEKHIFGTHAVKVMERLKRPVIIVPVDYYKTEIDKIVYASNYQEGDDESITQLLKFADIINAEVTILHVSHRNNPAKMEIFEAYRDFINDHYYYEIKLNIEQVVYEDVEEGLRDYMAKDNADMLAMLTQHRNFFEEMIHSSVTKKMAMVSEYPILIFHK